FRVVVLAERRPAAFLAILRVASGVLGATGSAWLARRCRLADEARARFTVGGNFPRVARAHPGLFPVGVSNGLDLLGTAVLHSLASGLRVRVGGGVRTSPPFRSRGMEPSPVEGLVHRNRSGGCIDSAV